ncbi:glutamate--cysteine ligase [Natroniella sp. ANB-PHB2]|uniref:glutamate--cysteine ligase n=1 Tax=Natroniella sp. ANB-PHB2 TaxID=3384444 RepID=UPI0038D49DA7
MEYQQQLDKLENFFKKGETTQQNLGVEFEHFIVEQNTWRAIDYREDDGIEDILEELARKGWKEEKENGYLVGLTSQQAEVTLEPGGQIEISIYPKGEIKKLEEVYFNFLEDFIPILNKKGYYLITSGYQPKSKIEQIEWNPKQRYQIMSDYLGAKGETAHNMMKGTAALQVALDYESEIDFIHKFRVANALSPLFAILTDNAPIFEGEVYLQQTLRTYIWDNTDPARTGIIEGVFDEDFGYRKYGEYILTREPILLKTNNQYLSTGEKTCQEIFEENEFGLQELEHVLTMVFPDVRLKQFIEIRMTDSIPPDLSWAMLALYKGLFYDQQNLKRLYKLVRGFSLEEVLAARERSMLDGLDAILGNYKLIELAKQLLEWAKRGLASSEVDYLEPLTKIIDSKETLATQIKSKLKAGRTEAFKSDILNFYIEEE